MSQTRSLMLVAAAAMLGGCGLTVPSLEEIPTSTAGSEVLTRSIAEAVRCELRDAVVDIIQSDKRVAAVNGVRTAPWFDHWGVQVALVLSVEERSSLSPTATYAPTGLVAPAFAVGLNASGSAAATRVTTLNFFYTVAELQGSPRCDRDTGAPVGSLLQMQSDLKIRESISAHILSAGMGAIAVPAHRGAPGGQNAVGHRVTFQVTTTGSVAPSWRLSRATIGQGGSLFATSRQRVHDLLVFFGPTDPVIPRALSPPAQSAFQASQISTAVAR